ncbi:MAG TPA: VWA domain-containing protein [Polyangia bacterium]|nr:VWA domain-containing protein [Polyangia bacterium]
MTRRLALFGLLAAGLAASAWGCGSDSRPGNGDADTDTDTDGDGDADADSDTDADCDEVDFPVAGNPPDILILLDRSYSMSWGSPQTYWAMTTGALVETTALMDSQIRFGLMAFPDGSGLCTPPSPGSPLVSISDINSGQIATQIGIQAPSGSGTPTAAAMAAAGTYLNSLFDGADKILLLATDGAPNCSSDMALQCGACQTTQLDLVSCYTHEDCLDDVQAIGTAQELHDSWGIAVYVVGVGGVVDVWDAVMDGIAAAGGTGGYYPATDAAQLQEALAEIAAASLDCTFIVNWESLDESVSDDPSLVNLYADGLLVPYSGDCANADGWHWIDGDTIEMCEGLCADYKSAAISVVTATFGCESIVE